MKPVIDIHAHVFRGRDIPLKGFLLSRKYEWYIKLLAPILFRIIAKCIRREGTQESRFTCGLLLEAVYAYMGQGYRRWAEVLSLQEVTDVALRMVETFDKDGIDLYVPLMIDYEYWFKNTLEPSIASQIDSVYEEIVLPFAGKIHPFAPFDPARELAHREGKPGPDHPDDGPPEAYSSLELVKKAIRKKGFIGVKVYNTLGYRPLGNAAVDDERRRIFHDNKMQRYSVFTGEQFDQVLSELYEFCVQEQVPIIAHCVSNGVEAYPGASLDFGRPEYWREVLDRFPDLHLDLAHFGWDHPEGYYPKAHWQRMIVRSLNTLRKSVKMRSYSALAEPSRADGEKTWVRVICEMLREYKYLFADVAHHSVVVDKDITKYKLAYKAMCNDFPDVVKKRLLFGIDWHVITRVDNYPSFKDKYIEVLKNDDLFKSEEIDAFLGGNALHFLGLLPLGTKPEDGWTGNRQRLQSFYESKHIDPPAWFKATA
jgi:predicted TIM-barrel fold metal-dependent hydrolase